MCLCFACFQTECAKNVDSPVMVPGGRMRTKPLIPEMCFTTITEEDSELEQQQVTPHLEEDGTSLLISCSQCSVRVHTSQYTYSHTDAFTYTDMTVSLSLCTRESDCVLVFVYSRLLRCGSSQCEQGVEMCSLQGQRHD